MEPEQNGFTAQAPYEKVRLARKGRPGSRGRLASNDNRDRWFIERERNMREPDVQQLDTELPHLKSKTPGEGSECVEEPSRALQLTSVQRLRRHERIRLLILSMGLFVIMLSTVFCVFSGTIVPLFATIVVVPLFYWCVDRYLNTSETSAHVT